MDIIKAEQEIAELQAKVDAEKARLSAMSPIQAKAEFLHEATCNQNHDDRCGWFYETWPKKGESWSRWSTKKVYVERVEKIEAAGHDINEAVRIFRLVRGY